MRTEEIVGAEKVFNALLDGRELTAVAGDVKMQIRGGLLIIRCGGHVTTVNIEDTPYTYPVPELKDGGKYKTRHGECVLISKPPKNITLRGQGLYSTKIAWKRYCTWKMAEYTPRRGIRWIL